MKKVTMSSVPKTKAEMNALGTGGLMTGTQVWAQAILDADDSSDFRFGILRRGVIVTGQRTTPLASRVMDPGWHTPHNDVDVREERRRARAPSLSQSCPIRRARESVAD